MTVKEPFRILIGALAVLWMLWALGWIIHTSPFRWGIQPRDIGHVSGIVTAPLYHATISHLLGNTISLFLLGSMIAASGTHALLTATLWAWLVSGFGIFLLGPSHTNHFGASGIAFGYLGYLLARGVYQKNFINVAVAIIVLIVFGSMLYGLLPFQPGISWQGHVFGLVGGILGAKSHSPKSRRQVT